MLTADLHIFRRIFGPLLATVLIALLILLLERMLRLLDLAFNSSNAFTILFKMLGNLVPHYMGMALPVAFFVGILVAFNRMSKDSELDVFQAAGIGLVRAWRPVLLMAIILSLLSFLVTGYLQPLGRYAYRSLVSFVTQSSITAGLEAGAFVHLNDMTILVSRMAGDRQQFENIFIHKTEEDGSEVDFTARAAALARIGQGDTGGPVLSLADGIRVTTAQDGSPAVLTFEQFQTPLGRKDTGFRNRGDDERELTFDELLSALSTPWSGISDHEVSAEFHGRLVRVLSVLFLPCLAIPLSISGGRNRRSSGIAVGLIILIAYNDLLQFGGTHTELGNVPASLGLWLPFGVFAAGSTILFYRASFRIWEDPLGRINPGLDRLGGLVIALLARARRSS